MTLKYDTVPNELAWLWLRPSLPACLFQLWFLQVTIDVVINIGTSEVGVTVKGEKKSSRACSCVVQSCIKGTASWRRRRKSYAFPNGSLRKIALAGSGYMCKYEMFLSSVLLKQMWEYFVLCGYFLLPSYLCSQVSWRDTCKQTACSFCLLPSVLSLWFHHYQSLWSLIAYISHRGGLWSVML